MSLGVQNFVKIDLLLIILFRLSASLAHFVLFLTFYFDVTKVSLMLQIEQQKFSVFVCRHGRNPYAFHFCC